MEDSLQICKNCKREVNSQNFEVHSAYCERKIKLCEFCKEPVDKNDFQKHLDEDHVMDACDLCDMPFQKWMLHKHKDACPRRLVVCKYCEAEFPFDEYPEHEDSCGSRTEKCISCRKYVMLKDAESHAQTHLPLKEKIKQEKDYESMQNTVNEGISKSSVPVPSKFNKTRSLLKEEYTLEKQFESVQNIVKAIVPVPSKFNMNAIHTDQNVYKKEMDYSERKSLKARTSENFDQEKRGEKFDSLECAGAAARKPEKSEAYSKHYGLCNICKQYIRWVDMNVHMPTCASDAGKCSRCHEDVSSEDIKDHILKYCSKLPGKDRRDNESHMDRKRDVMDDTPYGAVYEVDEEEPKKCPFCSQLCAKNHVLDHIRNCSKNIYQCPLCSEKLPEGDREMHENFYCKVLLDIQGEQNSDPPSYADTVKNSPHYSLRNKTPQMQDNVNCYKCKNSVSRHRLSEHHRTCLEKKNCRFCDAEITIKEEKNHLNICPGLLESEKRPTSKYSSNRDFKTKGAVPKHPKPREVQMTRCIYCDCSYNADMLPFHEKECIHKKVHCDTCNVLIKLKDLEDHARNCHFNKGRKGKKNKEKQKSEEKVSYLERVSNFLFKGGAKSEFSYQPQSIDFTSHAYYSTDPNSYIAGGYPDVHMEPSNTPILAQPPNELLLPCEFCDEVLSDELSLIVHMTGSHAELVSYSKKEASPKEVKKSVSHSQSRSSISETKSKAHEPSKTHQKRKPVESGLQGGDFLSHSGKDDENEKFVDASERFPQLQSFWDADSCSLHTEKPKEKSVQHFSYNKEMENSSDPEDDIKVPTRKSYFLEPSKKLAASLKSPDSEGKQLKLKDDEYPHAYSDVISQMTQDSAMDISPTSSVEGDIFENSGKGYSKFISSEHRRPLDDVEKMDYYGNSTEDLHESQHTSPSDKPEDRQFENPSKSEVTFDKRNDDIIRYRETLSNFRFSESKSNVDEEKHHYNTSATEDLHGSEIASKNSKLKKQFLESSAVVSSKEDVKYARLKYDANKKILTKENKMDAERCIDAQHDKYPSRLQTASFELHPVLQSEEPEKNIHAYSLENKVSVNRKTYESESSSEDEELLHALGSKKSDQPKDTIGSYAIKDIVTENVQNLASTTKVSSENDRHLSYMDYKCQNIMLKHVGNRKELDNEEKEESLSEVDISSFENIKIEDLEHENLNKSIEMNLKENSSEELSGFHKVIHNIKSGEIQPKEACRLDASFKRRSASDLPENESLKNLDSNSKYTESRKSLDNEDKFTYQRHINVDDFVAAHKASLSHNLKMNDCENPNVKSSLNQSVLSRSMTTSKNILSHETHPEEVNTPADEPSFKDFSHLDDLKRSFPHLFPEYEKYVLDEETHQEQVSSSACAFHLIPEDKKDCQDKQAADGISCLQRPAFKIEPASFELHQVSHNKKPEMKFFKDSANGQTDKSENGSYAEEEVSRALDSNKRNHQKVPNFSETDLQSSRSVEEIIDNMSNTLKSAKEVLSTSPTGPKRFPMQSTRSVEEILDSMNKNLKCAKEALSTSPPGPKRIEMTEEEMKDFELWKKWRNTGNPDRD